MPRIARVVIAGCPHHVTQRGNHRQTVFFADSERDRYLDLMRKYFVLFQVEMTGYALMTNHVHEVLIPGTPAALAKGVGRLHCDFARWQQIQRNLTGHLWQNRYYSCPLDADHFWKTMRYVELNPVRAGLVRFAWDWPWSSARAHVTGVDETGLLNMDLWKRHFDGDRWRRFLEEGLEAKADLDDIRLATRTGRPLGDDEFVRRLEAQLGRPLQVRKRGPKPGPRKRGLDFEVE